MDKPTITLHCGDCLEYMKSMPDKSVDLVLTDPPYGLNKKIHDGGTWATKEKFDDCLQWDFIVPELCWQEIRRISKGQIVWGGNYYSFSPSRCWLVWVKPLFPTMSDAELAWTSFDANTRVFNESRNSEGYKEHPTQKPIELMKWCICRAVNHIDSDTIFDPFMGSGTTGVAAKILRRSFVGCEISPKYYELAKRRIDSTEWGMF